MCNEGSNSKNTHQTDILKKYWLLKYFLVGEDVFVEAKSKNLNTVLLMFFRLDIIFETLNETVSLLQICQRMKLR